MLETFVRVLNRLSTPNPEVVKNEAEREILFRSNRSLIVVYLLKLSVYCSFIPMMTGIPMKMHYINAGFISLTLLSFIMCCRSYRTPFHFVYTAVMSLYAPFCYLMGMDFYPWVLSVIVPTLILSVTNDVRHVTVGLLSQVFFLNLLFPSVVEEEIRSFHPFEFTKNALATLSVCMLINGIKVGALSFKLKKAYAEIYAAKDEALEKQKNFLLSLSHELRNPLNSMLGNVQVALFNPNLPADARAHLETSQISGELLLHLINNILDSGKAEIGELEVNPTASNVVNMLERAWIVCADLIRKKGLDGCLRLDRFMPQVLKIDTYRFTQILMNIVGNAVKFTDVGKITIKVSWLKASSPITDDCFDPKTYENNMEPRREDERDLELHLNQKAFNPLEKLSPKREGFGILRIEIQDTGVGIPEESMSRLFSPFIQLTKDTLKRKAGTGLGLNITKKLCQKMGGDIKVYSQPGRGSSFVLCVPTQSAFQPYTNNTREQTFRYLRDKKIRALVVDDDNSNVTVISSYLVEAGVTEAQNSRDGIEGYIKFVKAHKEGKPYKLVTMDIDMEVLDGKTTMKKIRQYEKENKLEPCTILIITGFCGESDVEECMNPNGEYRASHFLKKPVIFSKLCEYLTLEFLP